MTVLSEKKRLLQVESDTTGSMVDHQSKVLQQKRTDKQCKGPDNETKEPAHGYWDQIRNIDFDFILFKGFFDSI